MNKEIGNVAGVSIMVNPETYEDIKKRKTIYENEILFELQHRIDKAIEYINEYKNGRPTIFNGCEVIEYIESDILLDILRGNDENICKN